MNIKLASGSPIDISVGSARTCYSSKLITPEDTKEWSKKTDLFSDLYQSGHHTTLQHVHFTFQIEGMSRLLIWRLLHGHAHYNSDQVSQRYAKVKPGKDSYYFPKSVDENLCDSFFEKTFNTYTRITEVLTKVFEQSTNQVIVANASKKAMELARYVLPQSVKSNLYHTINMTTALRYIKAAEVIPEATSEAKEFANFLKEKILEIEPNFALLLKNIEKQKVSFPVININRFPRLFNNDPIAVFDINDGLGTVIQENYSSNVNINSIFYPMESLSSFTCRMKISLSGDAQNQRHRTSIGLRPLLLDYLNSLEDFSIEKNCFIPKEIRENKECFDLYKNILEDSFKIISDLQKNPNVEKSDIAYFLPNAFQIEIIEKNDISNFIHKSKLRTCLNAQTEIRELTENIINKLKMNGVMETYYFVPPCVTRFRQNIHPFCTEGSRFCGEKVWKKTF